MFGGFNINLDPQSGLTSVDILDFEQTSYLNFEAEVYYPEDDGIKQVRW